jgi:hypothetical protein
MNGKMKDPLPRRLLILAQRFNAARAAPDQRQLIAERVASERG